MEDYNKCFNKGNDCDACLHQYYMGIDGDVEVCRRLDAGLDCDFIGVQLIFCKDQEK